MTPFADTDALRLWETARAVPAAHRAHALVVAACPDERVEALAALPVGHRNARLLAVRAATFGNTLPCEARCPACGEKLEFALDARALLETAPPAAPTQVVVDGEAYTFRLPTGADLMALLETGGDGVALLERCLVAPPAAQWPEEVRREAERRMGEADPLALIQLDLACPACGTRWAESFDPAAFLFGELAATARRALHDVHRLARAYGWREADVLALSPWRRQQYLAFVDG